LKSWKGTIVNWGFFVVTFTVIGLNQASFFQDYNNLLRISLIAFLTTFPLFHLLRFLFKKLNINKGDAVSMMLLGTIKNSGFASALALSLFDQGASIPGAIISAIYTIYMIWLGR
jgi:BASS family bile acid:Na+ symporter